MSSEQLLSSVEEVLIEDQDLRILKAVMTDTQRGNDFFSEYDPSLFSGDAKYFGQIVCNYYKKYKTYPTPRILTELLGDSHPFSSKCSYILSAISRLEFSTEEFNYDLAKLKQKHKKVRFKSLKEIVNSSEDYDEVVKQLKQEIEVANSLTGRRKKSFVQKTVKEYRDVFRTDYLERKANPGLCSGLATCYSYLDYVTGGAQNADLWIVAGETSSGKSTLLNNLGLNLWRQKNSVLDHKNFQTGHDVVYFSLEMPYKLCYRRTIAALANVALYGLRDANLLPP
ncbi:MAG: DnaB-like helicase C-terminal domain-containing protein, partial [Pedobacter agri]